MAEAERLLTDRGCPKIMLMVRSTNDDVVAFYNTLGYSADDVTVLGKRLITDCVPPRRVAEAGRTASP
jgi:hypothetical protein